MRIIKTPLLPYTTILIVFLLIAVPAVSSPIEGEEEFTFETWSKQKADGYRGSFEVRENRGAQDSRSIPIKYVRFPATEE